ncbi:unnamed protein product, partial [Nesidiocoris tenuis]
MKYYTKRLRLPFLAHSLSLLGKLVADKRILERTSLIDPFALSNGFSNAFPKPLLLWHESLTFFEGINESLLPRIQWVLSAEK